MNSGFEEVCDFLSRVLRAPLRHSVFLMSCVQTSFLVQSHFLPHVEPYEAGAVQLLP